MDETAERPRGEVRDNPARSRYELAVEGKVAIADYRLAGGTIAIPHTFVPPELRNRGVGSRLVEGVLADARARGLKVVPQCPFVAAFIRRHREFQDLIA